MPCEQTFQLELVVVHYYKDRKHKFALLIVHFDLIQRVLIVDSADVLFTVLFPVLLSSGVVCSNKMGSITIE